MNKESSSTWLNKDSTALKNIRRTLSKTVVAHSLPVEKENMDLWCSCHMNHYQNLIPTILDRYMNFVSLFSSIPSQILE